MRGFVLPAVGALVAMLLFTALVVRPHPPYEFGGCTDDTEYFLLSRAIVRGEPYAVNMGPQPGLAPYPFGLPLLLAPFVAAFPENPGAGKAIGFTATLLNIALLIWGWPRLSCLRNRAWAVAASVLYALSPIAVIEAQMLTADSVFTTIALAAFLICESCARRGRVAPLAGVALGFLMTLGLFTRTAGIALWPALLIRLWWRRPAEPWAGAAAFLLGGAALFLVPVVMFTSITAADLFPAHYASSFSDPTRRGHDPAERSLVVRAERGLYSYSTGTLREAIVPVGGGDSEAAVGRRIGLPQLPAISGVTVAALIVVGAWWSAGGALAPSILLFEAFHFGMLLLWHYRSPRLLYPLLPFLMLQLLWGARQVARGLLRLTAGRPPWLPAVAVAAAMLVAASTSTYKSLRNTNLQTREVIRDFREGTTWLRQNTPETAVVLADEAPTIHVYSGRPVVPLPRLDSEAELDDAVRRSAVRYILLAPALAWDDQGRRRYDEHTATVLAPLLESLAARQRLTLVYESPPAEMVRVYRLEP